MPYTEMHPMLFGQSTERRGRGHRLALPLAGRD